MTNQEIKDTGLLIRNEQQIGGNTALRVGGVIEGIGYALDNKDAANGYYQATINGGSISVNAPNFVLGTGGNLRIKMPAAGTTASTLTIGNANAVPLWYNGAAVSAQNTWEQDEIISVFYDGTRFMASNSQGGGGAANKIGYDNSQSGLASDDVQGALDDAIGGEYEIDLSVLTQQNGYPHTHSRKWVVDNSVRKHYIIKRFGVCNRLTVTANSSKDSTIQFFKSYSTPVNGADVPLCDGPLSTLIVPMGTTAILPIPDDCRYIMVLAKISTTNYIPTSVEQSVFVGGVKGNEVYDIDFSHIYKATGWVGATGEQVTTTGSYHYTIPLSGEIKYIEMTANNTINYTWATALSTSGWTRLMNQRFQVAAGEKKVVEVPDGALYIIIGQTTSSSGSDYTPSSARFLTQKGYDEELSLLNANDVNIPVDFSKQESLLGFVKTDGTWLKNDDGSAHYKIPVIGDSVTIESGESGGTYDSSFVFACDAEGIYWTVLTGQTRVVQQVSNAITYNIPEGARYLIVNKASSSSSTRDLTPRSVVFHKSSRKIIEENAIEQSGSPYTANKWRVMIYNIGHLNGGGASSQSSITDSNYDSKKFNLGELFDTFGTNIVGLAEYPLLFAPQSSHPDETTKDALFQKYWTSFIAPRRTDVTDLGYNALMARVPFEQLESVHYQGESLIRYYIRGYWNLLGIKVKFITSHLQYNTDDKADLTPQYAQIQEMLDDCANDSHAIIMGDLNTPAEDVVSYLTNGGYVDSGWKICNGSVYGTYNTYRNNDGIRGSKTLDNILIKGFDVEKVYMVVSSQSDHNALLTDIRVIV